MEGGSSSEIQTKRSRRISKKSALDIEYDANEHIPISRLIKIMQNILPEDAEIGDAKEAIQICASEFIRLVTSKANETCQQDSRSTITPEDVLSAMTKLGFKNYIEPLRLFLGKDHTHPNMNQDSIAQPKIFTTPHLPLSPPQRRSPLLSMSICYVPEPPKAADAEQDCNNFMGNQFSGEVGSSFMDFDPFEHPL